VCTVHVDGKPVRACVTKIEVGDRRGSPRSRPWIRPIGQALQRRGSAMTCRNAATARAGNHSAAALLARNPKPSDADIDEAMRRTLCRCGTSNRIRAAIKDAAATLGA
jgi:isoquinoline 1-oxidoreductase alpha subunit